MGKKIVIDTNVFISALGWNGPERKLVKYCKAGIFDLFISEHIYKELTKVLQYPKFKFSNEDQIEFLALISEVASVVEPKESVDVIKEDPKDNRILECACESKAEAIISGDKHLLKLREFREIKILRASDFLRKHRL